MKIALLTPFYSSVRGNAVTVRRIARGLETSGVTVRVMDLSTPGPAAATAALREFAPDLVHGFHAFRTGPLAARYAEEAGRPLVISLLGTDVNQDLFDRARRDSVVKVLRATSAVVAFHDTIRQTVASTLPEIASKISVIPQSVVLEDRPFPLAELVPLRPGEVRFLLPAGIRRVKNVCFPLAPLGELARRYPLKFLVAGPVLEEDEGARLLEALKGCEWAFYLGEVPHEQMGSLLEAVDVVINSSHSEGGMANSVLEAMGRGKAVLASDIPGNRSIIDDGVDGVLFDSPESFRLKAEQLIRDPGLRHRLGQTAREKVERCYPPRRELEGYLDLYRRLLDRSGPEVGSRRGRGGADSGEGKA